MRAKVLRRLQFGLHPCSLISDTQFANIDQALLHNMHGVLEHAGNIPSLSSAGIRESFDNGQLPALGQASVPRRRRS